MTRNFAAKCSLHTALSSRNYSERELKKIYRIHHNLREMALNAAHNSFSYVMTDLVLSEYLLNGLIDLLIYDGFRIEITRPGRHLKDPSHFTIARFNIFLRWEILEYETPAIPFSK